jgi:preprotein translocase subunit YajC
VTLLGGLGWAQGRAGGGGGGAGSLIQFGFIPLILIIFYFLLIRPQQQQQKKMAEMRSGLKKGDKVVTSSGIWGTITNLGKDTVTIQIADNTKVRLQRDHVASLRTDDEE